MTSLKLLVANSQFSVALMASWSQSQTLLTQFFLSTGLPPGVVNLVFGTGPKAGAPIVRHPDIPVISFTGSTATGQAITEMTAPFYKKLSLEVSANRYEHLLHRVHVYTCMFRAVINI